MITVNDCTAVGLFSVAELIVYVFFASQSRHNKL
jgi:hypothetical protein